jgi:hypothetical protein
MAGLQTRVSLLLDHREEARVGILLPSPWSPTIGLYGCFNVEKPMHKPKVTLAS